MLPSRDVAAVARHLGLDAGRRRARPGAAVPGDPPLARDLVERHGRRIAGKALDRRGELLQSFRSRVAEGLLGAGVEAWDVARVARDVPLALGVRDVRLERRPLLAPDAHPRVRMVRAERASASAKTERFAHQVGLREVLLVVVGGGALAQGGLGVGAVRLTVHVLLAGQEAACEAAESAGSPSQPGAAARSGPQTNAAGRAAWRTITHDPLGRDRPSVGAAAAAPAHRGRPKHPAQQPLGGAARLAKQLQIPGVERRSSVAKCDVWPNTGPSRQAASRAALMYGKVHNTDGPTPWLRQLAPAHPPKTTKTPPCLGGRPTSHPGQNMSPFGKQHAWRCTSKAVICIVAERENMAFIGRW